MTKPLKILLFDWNNILYDVAKELNRRGHILLPHDGQKSTFKKADVIVVWNEVAIGGWREWIKEARAVGKRVVLVQHGRRGTSRIFPPFNEELVSNVVCAWSENDRKRLESCGISSDRIVVTGTPIFKHLKGRVPHVGKNVVFSPEHWDQDVAENFIIKNELEKLKGVTVISKLLTGEHTQGVYPNPVWSDRKQEGHLAICADVLAKADLVVAVSESTFELMAEILDIPVVIADIWVPKACDGDERYREYHREYSNACTRVKDIKKLTEVIKEQLKKPQILRKERKEIGVLDGGLDINDPIGNIIKVIEN
jgi:hypothetical protein